MITRDECLQLDKHDALASLRDDFVLPEGIIYLDGNSLGPLSKATVTRSYQTVVDEWGDGLIASWNKAGWYELPRRVGNRLARLVGGGIDEIVVTDTISVNLFKLLAAALGHMTRIAPERTVIVSERGNFPSDLYIAQGTVEMLGNRHTVRLIDSPDELPAALGDDIALVMLTQVDYRSGRMHDMVSVTQMVKRHGALMIWDLAHSAGAVPFDLGASGADGAVGCTYKYLNAGPGAPGFIWVPKRNQGQFRQPLKGWWSHRNPFSMSPDFEPEDGIGRFLCGTPPIVSLSLVDSALATFEKTDMQALRAKSIALTQLFVQLVDERCDRFDVAVASPRDPAQRGSQISLTHPDAYAVMQALIHRGVVGDFREPNILRFGFTPLYLRHVDVWDAMDTLVQVLDSGEWAKEQFQQRQAVT